MSWEIFKQNILRVANRPEGISDIDVIAELYAKEYDSAVKRGFDRQHSIPLINGNVEMMKQLFISALKKGVNSSQPYDLVGEMGEGVKAYWAGGIMATSPLPITPAIQATVNLSVTQNIVTNPGVWQKPIPLADIPIDTELTTETRVQYQEELEKELDNYNKFIEEKKELEATAILDAVNKYTSILEENKDYNTEVTIEDAILGIVPGTIPTIQQPPIITSGEPSVSVPPLDLQIDDLAEPTLEIDESDATFREIKFNTGKPFVSGIKGGIAGISSYANSYVPFTNFVGNLSVGQKVIAIATYDAGQNIVELGKDTGHPRIVQMQLTGNGPWGGGTGFAWCACAVLTWWKEGGVDVANILSLPNGKNFYWPAVPNWTEWGIRTGRYVDMRNPNNANFIPKAGDAIIYDWSKGDNGASNHMGLFWKIQNGKWWGVDGNKGGPGKIKAHCIQDMGAVQGVIRI